MSAQLVRKAMAARFCICASCKRPVEAKDVRSSSRGIEIDVLCHGDRQTALFSPSEIEDSRRLFFFDEYRELDTPSIPRRIDLHIHIHVHGDNHEEQQPAERTRPVRD